MPEHTSPDPLVNFNEVASKVFQVTGTRVFIGGVELTPQERDLLREQAKYLLTSHLWEVMSATIMQESSDLALRQSTDWNHVLTAKQLHHWGHVFRNMINILAK